MSDPYVIVAKGLTAFDELGAMPDKIKMSAVQALNRTVDRSRTGAARAIRQQVNLPAAYLNRPDRLGVTKRATRADLQAVITGRHRPTSLAQFALGSRGAGKAKGGGVDVMVKPGLAVHLPRAFYINLRSGNTDTLGNLGIAIRLPNGQRPSNAYKPQPIGDGLWLLYGPSIDQVFDDVAQAMVPDTLDYLEGEFLRLMGLVN